MQFIPNGPDVPDTLLQAHEEGRVVFFCGAGISYPAGLPGFEGLVNEIYKLTGATRSRIENVAFERQQFDATLDLLERRLPGQRLTVRRALAQALTPNLASDDSTNTHVALLRLARTHGGALRLVTTNFDRVFDAAAERSGESLRTHSAPMLPIPKNSRWDGLVYLHGQLPETTDDSALNRLVVTSGDFGLAYLTERWAARFVSELFRNFVVCFVGYTINDPVLRYMMDALAADRMLGENSPDAWAFGPCEPGKEAEATDDWEAKGVRPILYSTNSGSHAALHTTIQKWGDTYRDGVLGKEQIVVGYALAKPSASAKQDDFVGRMLWALSDETGLPAKRFAELNPVPPLEWLLDAFADDRFCHTDLSRFGVSPVDEDNEKVRFSLIDRPAPYHLARSMHLTSRGRFHSSWDKVMHELARWLTRHLNDPRLILWIASRGGQLHERWIWLLERRLEHIDALERDGKTSALAEIRLNAPNAIPGLHMRTLWRVILSGRISSPWRDSDLYEWRSRLKRDGLTATLRFELRELLTPKLTLRKPFRFDEEKEAFDEPSSLRQLVDWELVLAATHVHSTLNELADEKWNAALPSLLEDFQLLVRDALDLLSELGEADSQSDRGHFDLPSISRHHQNRGFRDWVTLIELLRDAWLSTRDKDLVRARRLALGWFDIPYPTFKRLAFFAASQDGCFDPEQWVDWLLSQETWWLWSMCTRREVFRLLVLQGGQLLEPEQCRLEAAILAGPPRAMYRDDLEANEWNDLFEHSVWLHLAKLQSSGLALGATASQRLRELSNANPRWKLKENESDEFSFWMSSSNDPDYEETRTIEAAPRKRHDLAKWLKRPPPNHRDEYQEGWRDVCRTRFFHSVLALYDLAREGLWPERYWRDALQVWSEEASIKRSWRYAAPIVFKMPQTALLELAHTLTRWLEVVSKSPYGKDTSLFEICSHMLSLPFESDSGMTQNGRPLDQPVTEAINHPIGHLTQALLTHWLKSGPNDNDGLPSHIESVFTKLCDTREDRFRHARVLLGAHLLALFRVDRPWTEQHLLPLFGWNNTQEARRVWEGFLWSPRLFQPLLIAFKSQFLETARHYDDLGEHRQSFATYLTYAALGPIDGYTSDELRIAFAVLPKEGLNEAAESLSRALQSAADKREEYWRNRVYPFWQGVWPKSRDRATPGIAASLATLCIDAGDEFPAAVDAIYFWLQPIEHPHSVVHRLLESGNCSKFPHDAVKLLDAIVRGQPWPPSELGKCLEEIVSAAPEAEHDSRYKRLLLYWRKHGGE